MSTVIIPTTYLPEIFSDHNGLTVIETEERFTARITDELSKHYALDLMTAICRKDTRVVADIRALWDALWDKYTEMKLDVLEKRMREINSETKLFSSGTIKEQCLQDIFTTLIVQDIMKERKR